MCRFAPKKRKPRAKTVAQKSVTVPYSCVNSSSSVKYRNNIYVPGSLYRTFRIKAGECWYMFGDHLLASFKAVPLRIKAIDIAGTFFKGHIFCCFQGSTVQD